MNINWKENSNYLFIGLISSIMIATSTACAEKADNELTFTSPYSNDIGAGYRIVGEVNAYGIYQDLNKKELSYITLIPGVGIGGPEVAFRKRIPKGQTIKILSVWQKHMFLQSEIYYLVAIEAADLPKDVKIQIELSRGNEIPGRELNPSIYERIAK